jgi:ribosomal protein S6
MTENNIEDKNVGAGTVYEFSALFVPELDNSALSQIVNSITKKVADLEGEIISEGEPVYIKLAYEVSKSINNKIKRINFAHFSWIKFSLAPKNVAVFEKFIKEVLAESVMRYLVIKAVRENTVLTKLTPAAMTMADEALIEEVEAEAAATVETETAVEVGAITDLGDEAVIAAEAEVVENEVQAKAE